MEKKEFIKQWMKTYEPDTFKAGENGRYFYRSEGLSSGIDLECFFEDLLTDFESALAKETKQQSNCNLPDVSKCEGIEREDSCKHTDWIDLYYSSGDIYGRYCRDCGEFFE